MLALITGGGGFIGRKLASTLLAEGVAVRILDPLTPQIHGEAPRDLDWLTGEGVEFLRGSVCNRRDLEKAIDGVDYIVHLAAETGTGQSMYEIERYNGVNSQGTALLLDVLVNARSARLRGIVLASSRSIYGEGAYVCTRCASADERVYPGARSTAQLSRHEWEPTCPICASALVAVATREIDRVRPASIYAATKFAQEDLVRVACEALGVGHAILRFQNVYGEGQSLNNPYTGILSIFSTRVRRGLELTVFEDGLESRDFVHVEDVAKAIARCITLEASVNEIINVGSGVATSVLDVAITLSEALGFEPNVRVTGDYRIGDIRHNHADIGRMKTQLGLIPSIALRDGLRRFADWVTTQPLPADLSGRANAELRARKLMKS